MQRRPVNRRASREEQDHVQSTSIVGRPHRGGARGVAGAGRLGRGRQRIPLQAHLADRAVPGRASAPTCCSGALPRPHPSIWASPSSSTTSPAAAPRSARRRWPPAPSPTATRSARSPIPVFRVPYMQKATFDPVKDFTYIILLGGYTPRRRGQGRRPLQEMAGRHRLRQGQSRQVHLRHHRPRHDQCHRHGADGAPVGRAVHPHPHQGRRRVDRRRSSAATSCAWWNRRAGRRWWPRAISACS